MAIHTGRFAQGLPFTAYMAQMQDNRAAFAANYHQAVIPPGVCAQVRDHGTPLNVLVLTEDWCGDSLLYLPVLGRLAACAGTWTIRVFRRDQHLDLADQYLHAGGRRAIPVIVFFDAQMRELGRFIERPALANQERQALIDHLAATEPAIQAGRPAGVQSEAAQEILAPALQELHTTQQAAWQAAMIAEAWAVVDTAEGRPHPGIVE